MSHSSLCILQISCSLWHFSSLFHVCYTFDEIYTFIVENGTILHVSLLGWSRLHSPNMSLLFFSETGNATDLKDIVFNPQCDYILETESNLSVFMTYLESA